MVKAGHQSLRAHRDAIRGSAFPPPNASRPTFFHGFLLPFSLLLATLRHRRLGLTYLKLICARAIVVGVVAALAFHWSDGPARKPHVAVYRQKADKDKPVHVHGPGVDVDIDDATGEQTVKVLGAGIPVVNDKASPALGWTKRGRNGAVGTNAAAAASLSPPPPPAAPPPPATADKYGAEEGAAKLREGLKALESAFPKNGAGGASGHDDDDDAKGGDGAAGETKEAAKALGNAPAVNAAASSDVPTESASKLDRARHWLEMKWTWILWFIGVFSTVEGVIVFFTRRYDDWISFYASLLARTRPEDALPKPAKITFEPRWVMKKLKRRIRGYVVFGAGIPFIALFRVIPVAGNVLFTIGLTIWSWYWLTIFTTAKTAHAWADEHTAPAPYLIRELRDRPPAIKVLKPLNLYARLWARFTRSMNSPAMMFERAPAPFLGLALARVILSLPGIYLLARPIIPVASGRLCAETDPLDRFSLR